MFSELYFHFVEPHLSERRENWDNLSHGPTYSKEEEEKREEEEKELNRENDLKREREQLKKEESENSDQKKNENKKEQKAKSNKDTDEKKGGNNANVNGNPNSKEAGRITDHQGDPLSKTGNKDEKEAEKSLKDTDLISKDKSTEGKKLDKRTVEPISDAERNAHLSFEKCAQACEKNDQCFQYVYFDEVCKLGLSFRLGQYVAPKGPKGNIVYKSGWMLTRIREWQKANSCKEPQWPELFIE